MQIFMAQIYFYLCISFIFATFAAANEMQL